MQKESEAELKLKRKFELLKQKKVTCPAESAFEAKLTFEVTISSGLSIASCCSRSRSGDQMPHLHVLLPHSNACHEFGLCQRSFTIQSQKMNMIYMNMTGRLTSWPVWSRNKLQMQSHSQLN